MNTLSYRLLRYVCLAGLAVSAFAQTGTIQGVVLDPTGAAIANARITATDEDKKLVVRETQSGADGIFQVSNIQPGTYKLRIEAAGFKSLDRTTLRLDQNQILNLGNVSLQLGQATESVTVEAEVPVVETTTANKSFVITSRQVTELSLNGR